MRRPTLIPLAGLVPWGDTTNLYKQRMKPIVIQFEKSISCAGAPAGSNGLSRSLKGSNPVVFRHLGIGCLEAAANKRLCDEERRAQAGVISGLEASENWRKRVGVEPTRDRLAAPPGFEDRTPHRGAISSSCMTKARVQGLGRCTCFHAFSCAPSPSACISSTTHRRVSLPSRSRWSSRTRRV